MPRVFVFIWLEAIQFDSRLWIYKESLNMIPFFFSALFVRSLSFALQKLRFGVWSEQIFEMPIFREWIRRPYANITKINCFDNRSLNDNNYLFLASSSLNCGSIIFCWTTKNTLRALYFAVSMPEMLRKFILRREISVYIFETILFFRSQCSLSNFPTSLSSYFIRFIISFPRISIFCIFRTS